MKPITKNQVHSFLTSTLTLLATVLALSMLGGCTHTPSAGHVFRGIAKGTKGGITENTATGAYELGLQRVQAEVLWIPFTYATSKDGSVYVVIPDVVDRVEALGKASFFGNTGDTWTLSTGKGVFTEVGGKTPPVNSGGQTNQVGTPK